MPSLARLRVGKSSPIARAFPSLSAFKSPDAFLRPMKARKEAKYFTMS